MCSPLCFSLCISKDPNCQTPEVCRRHNSRWPHDESAYKQLVLWCPNDTVSAVEGFRFLGSTVSQDSRCTTKTTPVTTKDQQKMYFLLRKLNLPQQLLILFYNTAGLLSALQTLCGLGRPTKRNKDRLQQTLRSGPTHLQTEETGGHRCRCTTQSPETLICFSFSPQGGAVDLMKTRTQKNSFFLHVVTLSTDLSNR